MRSTPRPERPPERRRSQLSITRWFGGASSTDSEDEDDDVDAPRLDTTLSGDETPSFPVDDGDESVEVDDGAESEEKVLLPSGRRVSETPEDAGGGSAGVLTPDRRDTHYSPPQQDGI